MTRPSDNILPSSTHFLLSELHALSPGTRVRFLGRVTDYDSRTAMLTLSSTGYHHPTCDPSRSCPPATRNTRTSKLVAVDISLTLDSASRNILSKGAWISVLGYIAYPSSILSSEREAETATEEGHARAERERNLQVQAVLIVGMEEAGVAAQERFERVVEGRRLAMRGMEAARMVYGG